MRKAILVAAVAVLAGCHQRKGAPQVVNSAAPCTKTEIMVQVGQDVFRRVNFCLEKDGGLTWKIGEFVYKPKPAPAPKATNEDKPKKPEGNTNEQSGR